MGQVNVGDLPSPAGGGERSTGVSLSVLPCALEMNDRPTFKDFSKTLFWDVDPLEIGFDRNRRWYVVRVLEYGQIEDWKSLLRLYSLEEIVSAAQTARTLEPKALSFLSFVHGRRSFACFCSTALSLSLPVIHVCPTRSPCGACGSAYPQRGCSPLTGPLSMPFHGLARNRKNCFSPLILNGKFVCVPVAIHSVFVVHDPAVNDVEVSNT